MFNEYSNDELIKLKWRYMAAFNDPSPWNINKNHFFQCMKAVDEELTKRGVLVNEED